MVAKKPKIVILGETLVDLFFESIEEDSSDLIFRGALGGAPANVAANLSSVKIPVSLVTGFSSDSLGLQLKSLLENRNIDVSASSTVQHSKTPLALVLSSPCGEREFRLYLKESVLESFVLDLKLLPREMAPFSLPLKKVSNTPRQS